MTRSLHDFSTIHNRIRQQSLTRGGFLGKEPARGMCHPFAALRACPERSEGMTHRPSASFDSQNVFFEMYWPLSWSYERLSPPPRATQASLRENGGSSS